MTEPKTKAVKAKAEVSVNSEQQKKKEKKKIALDRPQPTWLFPPDEENPVLNPKVKSKEEIEKEIQDRLEAIKFLKHKAVNAPMKPAPPTQLITLIGAFLASYGFNSTGRIFTLERNARNKLDGWNDKIGARLDKGTPDLVKIYNDWSKEWQERRKLDMTSSEEDDDAVTDRNKMVKRREANGDANMPIAKDSSSSGSDESSDDDNQEEQKDESALRKKAVNGVRISAGSSSTSSSSDSDADDEKDTIAKKVPKTSPSKPTINSLVSKLKRKPPSSESSPSSTSGSESDSDTDMSSSDSPNKKKKIADDAKGSKKPDTPPVKSKITLKSIVTGNKDSPKEAQPVISSSDANSSDSDTDTSSSPIKPTKSAKVPTKLNIPIANDRKSSTDTTATLDATSPQKIDPPKSTSTKSSSSSSSSSSSPSSSSSSESEALPPRPASKSKATKTAKRKRSPSPTLQETSANVPVTPPATSAAAKIVKKQNVPFSRIPQDIKVDPKLSSNAYQPYDYAEKAHQDLVVTKGKGFTKEKNKKKRGSYRGGMIDLAGGKGVKFDE